MTMGMMKKRERSVSTVAPATNTSDATGVPGKSFLQHLHQVLFPPTTDDDDVMNPRTTRSKSTRRMAPRFASSTGLLQLADHEPDRPPPLAVTAPCLWYLQQLFVAMLIPTKSEQTELVTQWRLKAAFSRQRRATSGKDSEDDGEGSALMQTLGAASPDRILQLAGGLLEVDTLKIETSPTVEDQDLCVPSQCDLSMLPNLKRLSLTRVDLSCVRHSLACVAERIEHLQFSDHRIATLASLLQVPPPRGAVTTSVVWKNLRSIQVDHAQLTQIDASIASAPNLEVAVFNHNLLTDFGSLYKCERLTVIDLSHNGIQSLEIDFGVFRRLKTLNLSHNCIVTTTGTSFHGCSSLQVVDLSYNAITRVSDMDGGFAALPALTSLFLVGNSISVAPAYRHTMRGLLAGHMTLDGVPLWEIAHNNPSTVREKMAADRQPTTSIRGDHMDLDAATHISIAAATGPKRKPSFVRALACSCAVIAAAQLIVSTLWPRDAEAEQLTLWIVAGAVAFGLVSLFLALAASQIVNMIRSGAATKRSTQKSCWHWIRRHFFVSSLTESECQLLRRDRDRVVDVDRLASGLQQAVRAGEDVTLDQLALVCSQLKVVLAFFSGGEEGGGMDFVWLMLHNVVCVLESSKALHLADHSPLLLVRDHLGSTAALALGAAQPGWSLVNALTAVLPVLRVCAVVLTPASDGSDGDGDADHVLADAVRNACVRVNDFRRRSWVKQRIRYCWVAMMGIQEVPSTEAFLHYLQSATTPPTPLPTAPDRDQQPPPRVLREIVRQCGQQVDFLRGCLQELVDEHRHSFGHQYHCIS